MTSLHRHTVHCSNRKPIHPHYDGLDVFQWMMKLVKKKWLMKSRAWNGHCYNCNYSYITVTITMCITPKIHTNTQCKNYLRFRECSYSFVINNIELACVNETVLLNVPFNSYMHFLRIFPVSSPTHHSIDLLVLQGLQSGLSASATTSQVAPQDLPCRKWDHHGCKTVSFWKASGSSSPLPWTQPSPSPPDQSTMASVPCLICRI